MWQMCCVLLLTFSSFWNVVNGMGAGSWGPLPSPLLKPAMKSALLSSTAFSFADVSVTNAAAFASTLSAAKAGRETAARAPAPVWNTARRLRAAGV